MSEIDPKMLRCVNFFTIYFILTILLLQTPNSISARLRDPTISEANRPVNSTETSEDDSVLKWKAGEVTLKKAVGNLVKKALPLVLRVSEDLNLTTQCTRSAMKMLTAIKQMKLWAFQMLDTSGKIPNGLLGGNLNSLGDFDECLNVEVPGQFRGRYCTVELSPPLPPREPFTVVDDILPEFINFTDKDVIFEELVRKAKHYYYLPIGTSVCVPSTCTLEEVKMVAQKIMEMSGLGLEVSVPNCEIKEPFALTRTEIGITCLLSTILLLGISGTLVDVILTMKHPEKRNQSLLVRFLICFSFYSNTLRLLKEDNSPDTIKIFHGMKVITVLWVILNHSYYFVNLQASSGLLNAREFGKKIPFQVVTNGFLNVETFFFISAVLVAYGVMKMKERNLNIFLYIFRRLWRLTPPFMLIIATSFLVPHIGSGPVWRETVMHRVVDKCKANWWTNLLYFNNFVDAPEQCLQWLWYIPVDTQLYFLSLIVLLPMKRNPRLAFILNGVLLVVGIISTAVSNVYYKLPPTAIFVYTHPEDIHYYINYGYFRTYLHITTYCVGMAAGYFIATRQKFKIPLVLNILGWLMAFGMSLTVLYGVYDWNQGNVPGLAVSTLYTCTNKLIWSLGLAWVTICCFTGNGGIANSILSWKVFVPLSRLSYMAYLIHPLIQIIYVGSSKETFRVEHRHIVLLYLGYVMASFMCAFGFSLLFESPFMALEKILLGGPRSEKKTIKIEDGSLRFNTNLTKDCNITDGNGVRGMNIRRLESNG